MKILVVCGNGLGSSFIMELNVKKALNELGKEAEVGHTDLATARSEEADLYIGAQDIISQLDDGTRNIVALENVMNLEEIKTKIAPYLD
ncbi:MULTISPECIES: PTS sugar transporter subunit IIB [Thermoactinomyces]|jgi:ascorbate PTS system EIIB component|uniref:PTS sugar transporter subunit IIB n=1 Tax=Thermoactinomyces vulgaris TaxID=2026 RepID=A0ABS0QG70_THEVU|nr:MULTISPECIES: PTS sugar transporter subunit IIB [Thermoactinomyces]MBA4551803.1 PTS sugar transporter subunit IIB [Thermoactinomyces vulgaris]MBA4597134.1 PTS sugar transporter subunit IIB [Thermoactinomyces vulgaris]MBH8583451.1 PTS sugar transporter subunit IIB [Thermoactinomyces sp. CICC 10735]MBH8586367.1 PTS sugar transporter subunit IIB [Thermoactinomyces sp. CICC 10520]MBH8588276.1 PTS sugar transporter subunit IIB [Thermoactinomyces vulgaris]